MNQLSTLNAHSGTEFVEISHLLLHISGTSMTSTISKENSLNGLFNNIFCKNLTLI